MFEGLRQSGSLLPLVDTLVKFFSECNEEDVAGRYFPRWTYPFFEELSLDRQTDWYHNWVPATQDEVIRLQQQWKDEPAPDTTYDHYVMHEFNYGSMIVERPTEDTVDWNDYTYYDEVDPLLDRPLNSSPFFIAELERLVGNLRYARSEGTHLEIDEELRLLEEHRSAA